MKFAFTFGVGHEHNGFLVIIEAEDVAIARQEMFERFGKKWSMQYTEEEGRDIAKTYNLIVIESGQTISTFYQNLLNNIGDRLDDIQNLFPEKAR